LDEAALQHCIRQQPDFQFGFSIEGLLSGKRELLESGKSNPGDFHGGRGFVGFACGSWLVIRPFWL